MKKQLTLVVLVLLFFSFHVRANEVETLYTNANTLYQKGDYGKAVTEYNKIIQQGFESPEAYYNLGNAYYKISDYKSAILNYERAKRLAPQEDDILFNLKLANLNVIDKIEPLPPFFITSWWNDTADLYSADTWAVVTIVVFWIVLFLGILFLIVEQEILKRLFFFSAVVLLFFLVLLFSFTKTSETIRYNTREGIVFEPSTYIKSSPSDKGTDLFILHEGTKVKLMDEVGIWAKIQLANGNEGWIMLKDIQII
jgi:hypothetical protein